MKITTTILALAAAGLLGQSAFGDDNTSPLGFAITQNGHGSYHYMYYQQTGQSDTSVALVTNSGGVTTGLTLDAQTGPLADQGQTRFVVGTNQHGQAVAAYIPVSSNFGQARQ
jgi:hypothetical protein